MAARTVSSELRDAMKSLRLGQVLPTLAERITLAEKQDMPLEDFLLGILTDEVQRRQSASATRRADAAGLDPDMVFERWDKEAKVSYDRRVLQELSSLRFVETHRNVVILGPVGVGKTFVASALGHLACRSGFNVRLHRADDLLRLLRQSRLDNSREALMVELSTVDLLIVDDFALESMNRDESSAPHEPPPSSPATATPPSGSRSSMTRCSDRAPSTASRTTPTTSSSTASPTAPSSSPTSPTTDLRLRLRCSSPSRSYVASAAPAADLRAPAGALRDSTSRDDCGINAIGLRTSPTRFHDPGDRWTHGGGEWHNAFAARQDERPASIRQGAGSTPAERAADHDARRMGASLRSSSMQVRVLPWSPCSRRPMERAPGYEPGNAGSSPAENANADVSPGELASHKGDGLVQLQPSAPTHVALGAARSYKPWSRVRFSGRAPRVEEASSPSAS